MSEPAALQRARQLRQHINHLGAPLEDFFVLVTPEEAWDVIRWYRDELKRQEIGEHELNVSLLDHDIERARRKGDPFPVLENFSLFGLTIRPSKSVH